MKEKYFTSSNIGGKSRHMLDELREYRDSRAIPFRPESAALLIIDMQKYFLAKNSPAFIAAAPAIIPKIRKLRAAFEGRGRPVVFTRHLNSSKNAGMLLRWWEEIITAGDPLSEIAPGLGAENAGIIVKTQYDAFHKTSLESLLRKRGVEQVVITGVMTHLCCETTARSAFMRGFAVFFPVDGTASQNEGFHRSALLNLSHGFAVPVLVSEVLKYMRSA